MEKEIDKSKIECEKKPPAAGGPGGSPSKKRRHTEEKDDGKFDLKYDDLLFEYTLGFSLLMSAKTSFSASSGSLERVFDINIEREKPDQKSDIDRLADGEAIDVAKKYAGVALDYLKETVEIDGRQFPRYLLLALFLMFIRSPSVLGYYFLGLVVYLYWTRVHLNGDTPMTLWNDYLAAARHHEAQSKLKKNRKKKKNGRR